jgi:hypothetical protein
MLKHHNAGTPNTKVVLGVDPGGTTGLAVVSRNPMTLLHASTFSVSGDFVSDLRELRSHVVTAVGDFVVDRVVVEGWMSFGRATNVHAGVAQVMTGAFGLLFAEFGWDCRFLFSGDWKRHYGGESGFLPEVEGRVRKEDIRLARRIQADLGGWPTVLDGLAVADRGHAINAAALAIHGLSDVVWRSASGYPIRLPVRR